MILLRKRINRPLFSRMIFSRYLDILVSGLKTKICSRNPGEIEFTRRNASADDCKTKRIMIFGDSNAFRPGRGKNSWPKLFADKDPLHLNVFNESLDGRTTRYDIGGLNGLGVIGKKLAAHAPLDAVMVMLGTNDVKDKYGPPSPAEIADGMRRILEIIEHHGGGAIPVLLTPPPMGNVISGELTGARQRIHDVATEYRRLSVSRDVQLIDIYSILEIKKDLEADMIHLNDLGRRKVADAVSTHLQ